MPTKDTSQIKNNIIEFLKENGPSLPVHIGKAVGMDMLFVSAFLSELLNEQKIKISNMKVGTSPIYYFPGTEEGLEKYSQYLNFKEKEAFNLLKQNKFLIDEIQHPAIRVALKSIPDFAKSFEKNNQLTWVYFLISEEESSPEKKVEEPAKPTEETLPLKEEKIQNVKEEVPKKEEVKLTKKKTVKKKPTQKKNDKFFNTVKEYLASKQIEILDIEGFSKDDLMLKVKINGEEKILIAFNKKRISEDEILKAHKKAKESDLKYMILSFGEPLKKTNTLIEAIKQLDNISKIE